MSGQNDRESNPSATGGGGQRENNAAEAAAHETIARYWKANVSLLIKLLLVWFVVSFGFGILLVEPLNAIRLGGFKLGFWFAQQGSIFVFIVLIFVYAFRMQKIEHDFGVDDD